VTDRATSQPAQTSKPSDTDRRPRRIILERHPRHPLRLAAAAVLLFLSSLPVRRDHVGPLEARIFEWLNGLPDALYWPMWAVMQCGNFFTVPLVTVIALAARRVRLALDVAVAGTGAWLLAKIVKQTVVRGRPAQLLGDVILRHAPAAGHGYLSGHAATAVALATVLNPFIGPRLRWILWAAAALVCVARVYVGAHLPLDVAGGAAMGWAIGSLVHTLLGAPAREEVAA
jgi:membrane-associated phospholipid phosphatase